MKRGANLPISWFFFLQPPNNKTFTRYHPDFDQNLINTFRENLKMLNYNVYKRHFCIFCKV